MTDGLDCSEVSVKTGADAVVAALLDHGLKTLYCLPGIQNDALLNSLFDRRNEINVVHTRHEQGAAYMARSEPRSLPASRQPVRWYRDPD
jgi:thiamine pyrophosphate-dependent acetolactate synthase large subunit-like protein